MLRIVNTIRQLNFYNLMEVYAEENSIHGREFYPDSAPGEQIRNAEQDFYHFLNSVFFKQSKSIYAIWESDGRYLSALRLEPYADGLLLCGLVTAPAVRQHGYGFSLICALQDYLGMQGSGNVYSHVAKKNTASLNLHLKCNFQIIKGYAVFSDGSVSHESYTLRYQYKKAETV